MSFYAGDMVVLYSATGINATFSTDMMPIERFGLVAVQAVVTNASGDIAFSAQPEISLDGVNWDAWSQPDAITSLNLNSSFNIAECAFTYLRITFTRTAGSGDFKVMVRGKQG